MKSISRDEIFPKRNLGNIYIDSVFGSLLTCPAKIWYLSNKCTFVKEQLKGKLGGSTEEHECG